MIKNSKEKEHSIEQQKEDAFFIVDLDNVLFDTSKLKGYLNSAMKNLVGEEGLTEFMDIWQEYYKKRDRQEEFGLEDIFQEFAEKRSEPGIYEKLRRVYLEKDFQKFAQQGYRDLLFRLKKHGKVIVFTEGFLGFQKKKVKALGLEEIVGAKNIRVFAQKEKHIKKILKEAQNFDQTVVIEDKAKVIGKFREKDPELIGIWVRYGYHKKKNDSNLPASQFKIENIEELTPSLLNEILSF